MAVVPRKRKSGIVYFVATRWRGRVYFERVGAERREAERLSDRRKREVAAGTFQPPAGRAPSATIASHAARWLELRRTRSAKLGNEAYLMGYVTSTALGAMALDEVRPRHVVALVNELSARLAPKTVTSAISLLGVMYRDAVIAELVPASPVVLPRGLLRRTFKRTVPYDAREVECLLAVRGIHGMLATLALYSGMRPGEIAGRRWRDWDQQARPLGGLLVATQYEDQPLKGDDSDTDRPRMLPVHAALRAALEAWQLEGWSLTYGDGPPGPEDLILPSRRDPKHAYTRSGIYQLWRETCRIAGVDGRELRATRNTFITFARRSSPRDDVIEEFTHNAVGRMIDRYNRFQWAPRCDVMAALSFAERFDEVAPRLVSGLQRQDSNRAADPVTAGNPEDTGGNVGRSPERGTAHIGRDAVASAAGQRVAADAALSAWLRAMADHLSGSL